MIFVEGGNHDRVRQIGPIVITSSDPKKEDIGPFLVIHLKIRRNDAEKVFEVEGGDVLISGEDHLEDDDPGEKQEQDEEEERHFFLLVFFLVRRDRSYDFFQQ